MTSRLLTFVVWALVTFSGLFWGLRLVVHAPGLPASVQAAVAGTPQGGSLGRVLGTVVVEDEAAPDEGHGRFQLLGIVAPVGAAGSTQGVALISVGGQPAKPWRTGAVIEDGTVLLSVSKRSVQLGPQGGPASAELSLPDPNAAAHPAGAVPSLQPSMPRVGIPGQIQPQPQVGQPLQPGEMPVGSRDDE